MRSDQNEKKGGKHDTRYSIFYVLAFAFNFNSTSMESPIMPSLVELKEVAEDAAQDFIRACNSMTAYTADNVWYKRQLATELHDAEKAYAEALEDSQWD